MKLVVLAVLVAALVVPSAFAGSAKLSGTVGPGFTITLKQGSKVVKQLKAGTYTIAIADKSVIHDFHLMGPGVNKSTTVPFTGSVTWTVKLKKGTYKYQCDPHKSFMHGSFKVT